MAVSAWMETDQKRQGIGLGFRVINRYEKGCFEAGELQLCLNVNPSAQKFKRKTTALIQGALNLDAAVEGFGICLDQAQSQAHTAL